MCHNYKRFFSIILLALVDTDYKFLWVDMGVNGSMSDCAVYNQSQFKEQLENGTLGLSTIKALPGDDTAIPHFMIGNDDFPL